MKRIYSFNMLRILAAIGILLYHTYWNFGCTYGRANYLISQSTYCMTTFFMLSGFVICYANYYKDFFSGNDELLLYIKKRFWSLFPTYFLIFVVFLYLYRNTTTLFQDLVTLPFQLTLTYGFEFYGHIINWGAWFFSLIFMCYFIAPFFIYIIKIINRKKKYYTIMFAWLLITVVPWIGINAYNNFFMRFCEFYIGMVLAALFIEGGMKKFRNEMIGVMGFLTLLIISCLGVYFLQIQIAKWGLNHVYLNGFNTLMNMCLIFCLARTEGKFVSLLNNNLIIKTVSDYSMEIWCGTFFSSYIFAYYIPSSILGLKRIFLEIVITIFFAVLLGLYRNSVNRFIKNAKRIYMLISLGILCMVLLSEINI